VPSAFSFNTWVAPGTVQASWNDPTNWSLGNVPTTTEVATFDASSAAPCNIDAPLTGTNSIHGINITSAYAATITQTADLILADEGFVQGAQGIGARFINSTGTTITDSGVWSEANTSGPLTGFTGNGTVNFNSGTTQFILDDNTSFGALVHSGSGTLNLTLGASALNVASLTNSSGTLNAHGEAISVNGGNWSDTSSVVNLDVVTFGGLATQNISANSSFSSIIDSNLVTLKALTPLTLTGDITILQGSLDLNNQNMTLGGSFFNSSMVINTNTVTFSGGTGTIQQFDSGLSAFNSIVHSGAGTLKLINNPLTINQTLDNAGGTFEANGLNLTVTGLTSISSGIIKNSGAMETMTFIGGLDLTGGTLPNVVVSTGQGTAVLGAGVSSTSGATIAGNLDLGGANRTFTVTGNSLVISALISNGGISKDGNGFMFLSHANTYTGGTFINAGLLAPGVDGALGPGTGGTTVTPGGGLVLAGLNYSTPEPLALNGGSLIADTSAVTDSVFGGPITVGADGSFITTSGFGDHVLTLNGAVNLQGFTLTLDIRKFSGGTGPTTFVFNGPISGTNMGSLTVVATDLFSAPGILTLNGAGSYGGGTTVNSGTLLIGNDTAVGTGTLTMADQTIIGVSGASHALANNVTLNGATTVEASSNTLTLNGIVSGSGFLIVNGNLTLTAQNTYGLEGGTTVNGATLGVEGDLPVGDGPLTLNDGSILFSPGGANTTITNEITLNGSVTVAGTNNLTLSGVLGGPISGTGSLTDSDSAFLILGGQGANSYSGGTIVTAGTLLVGGLLPDNRLGTGPLVLNDGTTLDLTSGTVNNPVTLKGTSTINVMNGPVTLSGVITGTGGFTLYGVSRLQLVADNTYSGMTTLGAGPFRALLNVTGSQPNSSVVINSGAELAGVGTVGAVTVSSGGTLAPGAALTLLGNPAPPPTPGILTTGNLQLNGGTVAFQVNGLGPGPGYSQVRVNGTVNLGSGVAILAINGTLKPQSGDLVRLIDNVGGQPITGFFNGAPEGTIENDPIFGRILFTYKGAPTGNSFVVTAVPIVSIIGRESTSGQWWLGRSNGSQFATSLANTWNPAVTWVDVQTGDFNGDGLQDTLGRDRASGSWWVALANGSGGFTNALWGGWSPAVSWVDVQLGDFNGDSRMDIVGRVLQSGQWWIARSTGSSFVNSLMATWNPAATWADVKVGDFNGDGQAEIIGRDLHSGTWWAGVSTGPSFNTAFWGAWNPAVTWVDVNVGDFNGDGKADLVGRYLQAGQWWVSLSSGSSLTNSLWATWNPGATWVDVKVGDFNGDGMADLTGRYLQGGQWYTALSTGSSFTTALWGTWNPAAAWVDVQIGDFNCDGKTDLTGRYLQGGQWYTGISTGSSFTTALWTGWSASANWVDVQNGFYE
jgi:autotransporter-associated beta strand protein